MQYYIGECGSSGQKFDSIQDFLTAIEELANACQQTGEEWFEIEVINV